MAARVYWIEGPWKGRLAIVPRPRGGDWLKDEVSSWREVGIDVVVSFLTQDEVDEFNLESEKELSETRGIRFISSPIPDRGIPASKVAAATLLHDLKQLLVDGKKVALHCRQSVGRSALIAASLLVAIGEEPRSAFERIASARGGKVPDSAEQEQWVADLDSADKPTKGERLFEAYLLRQGITRYEFEKKHPGKLKKPDYSVKIDREYLFDVKDFEAKSISFEQAYDWCSRIRDKIEDGRKKFKEYKEWPCCLVLYDNNASFVFLSEPEIMLGAMEGNYGFIDRSPALGGVEPSPPMPAFLSGGKMNRPGSSEPQNRTISALITLRHVKVGPRKFAVLLDKLVEERDITPAKALAETCSTDSGFDRHERQLGVIVWENRTARIPFPQNLFRGPYDERYISDGNKPIRIFAGAQMLALEELERSATLLRSVTR